MALTSDAAVIPADFDVESRTVRGTHSFYDSISWSRSPLSLKFLL
jgi:hypothetical protein